MNIFVLVEKSSGCCSSNELVINASTLLEDTLKPMLEVYINQAGIKVFENNKEDYILELNFENSHSDGHYYDVEDHSLYILKEHLNGTIIEEYKTSIIEKFGEKYGYTVKELLSVIEK